jgi:predicted RNA polymerase sigma factor
MMELSKEAIENRMGFHPATKETRPLHEELRAEFIQLGQWLVDTLPESPEATKAIETLQLALMYSNAAVAIRMAPAE